MESPLSRFLTRFPVAGDVIEEDAREEPVAVETKPEIDPVMAAAEARLTAALAEAEVRAERQIVDRDAAHAVALAQALTDARSIWCEAEGAGLAKQIDGAIAKLCATLDEKIADALTPLLAEAVVTRTRAALSESLDLLLTDPDHPALTLRGPGDFIDAIRQSRMQVGGIAFVAHDDLDVIVTGHGLRIETCLEAALAALVEDGN